MNYFEQSLIEHEKHKGKISITSKMKVTCKDELSVAYTPGVAEPCREIFKDENNVYKYTSKGNMVAVITDGTAVLGLGNIGPKASLPVMEGKSILFKEFADVDSFPLCLDTTDVEEFIKTVKILSPSLGGINLEDIASPKCFEIEKRLEEELSIPVFHDDQHGTAIVVTAALINALKLVKKDIKDIKVVLNGPGAAGTAIIKMLLFLGVENILACDENGIINKDTDYKKEYHKNELAKTTNIENLKGDLSTAICNADVFIGVSVPNCLTKEMIKTMNKDSIVFAMANPTPEIMYDDAISAGVKVMGTGRSDFPNQINNVLAFPGIFKGALSVRARDINYDMKLAAAYAIANLITEEELNAEYIIPNPFDKRVVEQVANAVAKTAIECNLSNI